MSFSHNMIKIKILLKLLYRHHFIRYLFVGGTTFIIDFCLLIVLYGESNVNLGIATSISYWTAVTYNFCLNRWWTFSAGENKNLRHHITIYAMLLGINYGFTLAFIGIVSQHINYAFAKILAIPIQMTWTYYVYKNVIFIKTIVIKD